MEHSEVQRQAAARAQAFAMPIEEIDPADARLHEQGVELHYFERLRRDDPVHKAKSPQFGEYWSITKYNDIMKVDTNHQVFSSDWTRGGITLVDAPPEQVRLPMFISMDPPRHDDERKAVSGIVAPGNLANMEALIRERTVKVLDSLPRGEEFDWVDTVSVELTTLMLATLFDFPLEDRRLLPHWTEVATSHPLMVPNSRWTYESRMAELGKMLEYFMRLWNERVNAPPKFDLVSMLAHNPATRNMTPHEFMGNLILLIVGGNDTTRNSMTGGLLALSQNPAEFAKLRANPKLVDNMVSEIIRWQTPLAHMRRTAVRDAEIGGKTIREGDKVAMWYVSGNRDSEVIQDADRFVIDRPRARQHLSFGFGIHRCVGNRLAEMQLRILWEEILARDLRIEVTGEAERVCSPFVRGYSRMPVRIAA